MKNIKKKIIYRKILNRGVIAKSRNLGMKVAKGEWLAFLDSDDTWKKEKLSRIYNKIKTNKFDVICHGEWLLKKGKKKFELCGPNENNFYQKLILMGNRLSTSASIVNKRFIKKNQISFNINKKFITTEDYYFFLECARKRGKFHFLNEALGYSNIHEKSASSNFKIHTNSENEVLKHHIFKLQNFTKDKNKLWNDVQNYRKIKKNLVDFKNNKTFQKLLNNLISHPFKFSSYCRYVFLKKLKQFYYILM